MYRMSSMKGLRMKFSGVVALVALVALVWGCQATGGQEAASEDSGYQRPDEVELIKGEVSADGLQAIFATPDLSSGEQRIAVVLTSQKGLVRSPIATMTSFYYAEGAAEGEKRDTAVALFRPFPLGTRGLYSAQMDFDAPGQWRLEIAVLDDNASTLKTDLRFEVAEQTAAPAIGAAAIASDSKTINDTSIEELTTGSMHDPELYQLTIADAVESGIPTVIVMASPAFCTNAVCGPQVDVLRDLKNMYEGQANFIHVDFYDNPTEIQGDLTRAKVSPTVIEWNLPSTEWSFVVDSQGIIQQRFEGFAPLDELEDALLDVLG